MYQVRQNNNPSNKLQELILCNKEESSKAVILLNLGASLEKLTLKNQTIIKDISPLQYSNSYASSILFPFVNRLKNGTYNFLNKTYTLDLNLKEENNALHGLVYNKPFTIIEQQADDKSASVKLVYKEIQPTKGFPFKYIITLIYTLTEEDLKLSVSIKNIDSTTFPFTVGWHPYFTSSNLSKSIISFKSDEKITFNENLEPCILAEKNSSKEITINNTKFDDCYKLSDSIIHFCTPQYAIQLESSAKENFVQIFTPEIKNTIAIEPTTGVSNSFNNKIGLQILEPNNEFTIQWSITINHEN